MERDDLNQKRKRVVDEDEEESLEDRRQQRNINNSTQNDLTPETLAFLTSLEVPSNSLQDNAPSSPQNLFSQQGTSPQVPGIGGHAMQDYAPVLTDPGTQQDTSSRNLTPGEVEQAMAFFNSPPVNPLPGLNNNNSLVQPGNVPIMPQGNAPAVPWFLNAQGLRKGKSEAARNSMRLAQRARRTNERSNAPGLPNPANQPPAQQLPDQQSNAPGSPLDLSFLDEPIPDLPNELFQPSNINQLPVQLDQQSNAPGSPLDLSFWTNLFPIFPMNCSSYPMSTSRLSLPVSLGLRKMPIWMNF